MKIFSVRKIEKSDLDSWAEMRTALWPNANLQEHLLEATECFGIESMQSWVALVNEQYIGFAEASIRPYVNGCRSRPVVFLEGVWVAPSQRKKGVGKALVAAAESWARSMGIHEIGSDAALTNMESHACHNKWGFEETERVVYYRKTLP